MSKWPYPATATDEQLRAEDFKADTWGEVHDWRNHVGENTKRIWSTFNDAQRRAIALDADHNAGNEQWS